MRTPCLTLGVALALAVVACGASAGPRVTAPPPVTGPDAPPPAYEAARLDTLIALDADATHIYWIDEAGLWRRPHGADARADRMFASDELLMLSVGDADVFVATADGVRAIPKAGGAPIALGPFDELPIAIAADGDGVFVLGAEELLRFGRGGEPRRAALGHHAYVALAAAGGEAYLAGSGEPGALVRVDASDQVSVLSHLPIYENALQVAVSGPWVMVATESVVLAVPHRGGPAQVAFRGPVFGLDADDDGYAAVTSGIITQRLGDAPRVVALPTDAQFLPTHLSGVVAVTGPYAYYAAIDGNDGRFVVRAAPRAAAIELWRAPPELPPIAFTMSGDRAYAAFERAEGGSTIVEIDARGARTLVETELWPFSLAVSGHQVLAVADGTIYRLDRKRGQLVQIAEGAFLGVTLHKRHLYWGGEDMKLWAMKLSGGAPFVVTSFEHYTGEYGSAAVQEMVFASNHLYLPLGWAGRSVVLQVDERGRSRIFWEGPPGADGGLAPTIAKVEDALYVTDGLQIWRIPLDGGTATTLAASGMHWRKLLAVRGRLVAIGTSEETGLDRVVVVPLDGGASRTLLDSTLDGGVTTWVGGGDAVHVYSTELGAVLRVPVP